MSQPSATTPVPPCQSSPFKTIQKCASIAIAGDTCLIRQGTYRETVTPANSGTVLPSPITIAPYNNEKVTISGTDEVTGWTTHSGAIYKTQAMNWDLGPGKKPGLCGRRHDDRSTPAQYGH